MTAHGHRMQNRQHVSENKPTNKRTARCQRGCAVAGAQKTAPPGDGSVVETSGLGASARAVLGGAFAKVGLTQHAACFLRYGPKRSAHVKVVAVGGGGGGRRPCDSRHGFGQRSRRQEERRSVQPQRDRLCGQVLARRVRQSRRQAMGITSSPVAPSSPGRGPCRRRRRHRV